MGELTNRISAEDFVTPPELAEWKLSQSSAGRVGGVRFDLTADAQGRTRLGRCYQQIPLRVNVLQLERRAEHRKVPDSAQHSRSIQNFTPIGSPAPALVYLVNPTAGLMDGDGQLIDIVAGADTRAVVVGQSATRIHPSVNGFCTQQWRVTVHPGAVLVILPGPAIPFQGCRYYQRVQVELHAGAQLIWGDVWTAGRHARGDESELFRFDKLVQDLTVSRANQLVYRDRFCWQGPWNGEFAQWHFGAFPAYGSMFATGPGRTEEREKGSRGEGENDSRSDSSSRSSAMFPTAHGDRCCRWLGSAEDVIRSLARTSLSLAAAMSGDMTGTPWLLSGNHLGPNHWFSSM